MVCIQKQHMNSNLLDGKNLCLKVLISLLHVLSHMVQSNILSDYDVQEIHMRLYNTKWSSDANYTLEEPDRYTKQHTTQQMT